MNKRRGLVGIERENQSILCRHFPVLVKYGSHHIVNLYGDTVGGLYSCHFDMVVSHVIPMQAGGIRIPQAGKAAEHKDVTHRFQINGNFTFSWDLTGTSLWLPAFLVETVPVSTRNS